MPAAPCPRRRRIYQRQLDDTKQHLTTLVAKPPFTATDAGRLSGALADPDLIGALEELLNIYVVYGVARDLQRLAPTKVLLLRDTTDLPSLDAVLPSDGSPPTYTAAGAAVDPDFSTEKAYERYFAWYIDPPDVSRQGEDAKTGVEAFYERYPLLAHAVQTVTAHHKANIRLACQRVATDWSTIQAAFFPGRTMEQLVKIRTTGNDFHKGGKQVLILTFLLDDGMRGQVVYKPSAVEIDCRIVGDSDIVNALAPQGYRQDASLTELINKFNPARKRPEGFTSRPLPTYRILPYNRDSVPDAYGYIEFLTHEPRVKVSAAADEIPKRVGEEVMKVRPADVKASDWIVDDAQVGQVFYHQFGGVMAMAMAVSLSDLHVQNLIAHDRSPHLIDLEEALKKPMTAVADTQLTAVLGRYADPGGNELVVDRDQTSKLAINWKLKPEPAPCVLYLSRGTSASAEPVGLSGPAGSDGERNRRAVIRGLVDVIEALATPECNDAVKAWVQGLGQTIARYVTRATQEYAQSCRDLYQIYCENSIDALAQDSGYKDFKFRNSAFFVNQVSYQRKVWTGRLGSARPNDVWGTPAPSFGVEHPTHAWRDYLNCDVPSFYHLLGSPDLLNSKGDRVDVRAVVDWQDQHVGAADDVAVPDDWQPDANGAYRPYLPQRPVDMVVDQLEQLKQRYSTAKGRREVLTSALAGAGALESDFTRLARGLLVSRPERSVAPVGSEQT